MNKFLFIIPLCTLVFYGASCGVFSNENTTHSTERIRVVSSFYPVGYLVDQVGGEYVESAVLVGAGVEPHEYEPTVQDAQQLAKADVIVYSGLGMDDWIVDSAKSVESKARIVVLNNADDEWVLAPQEEEHHEEEVEHHDEHGEFDPHTWLSMTVMSAHAQRIADALSAVDPTHAEKYATQLASVQQEFSVLGTAYRTQLAQCELNTFITSHDAFSYLAHEYGLTMESIAGLSPEEEPSAATIAALIEHVKEDNIPVIFFETLASPKIAETIAAETGAKTMVLNPLEGLTEEQSNAGVDYIDVMRTNLEALKVALRCR